jgi:hypothetical protein
VASTQVNLAALRALSRTRRPLAAAGLAAMLAGPAACGGLHLTHHRASTGPGAHPLSRPAGAPPLISIFEAPAQLASAPGPTLDELRRLGVEYVRVSVPWAAVAPDSGSRVPPSGFRAGAPSAYPAAAWRTYDAIVTAAAARGIGVQLDPTPPAPEWAVGPDEPNRAIPGVWRPSAAAFGQFVRALGIRYSGRYTPPGGSRPLPRVRFWSIWNEPNYGPNLAPQAIDGNTVESSAVLYRALLDAAWSALAQTGHRHDTILIGELAPRGITGPGFPGNFAGMVPLRFLRALYCVDGALRPLRGVAAAARACPTTAAGSAHFPAGHPALFDASGVAVHPYPQGALAPNVVTANEPDYADLATLPRLERQLDAIMADYGLATRLAVYSTEYGYLTDPPYVAGVPLALAPAYLNWAEYLSWLDPQVRSFDQYLLTDPPVGGPSQFDTGLEFADGAPKPTLAAYRLPLYLPRTRAARGRRLEVWGCVRPARYARGPGADRGLIQFSPGAGRPFRTLATVAVSASDCYFDVRLAFPSSGLVELTWTYPGGVTIHSRRVRVSVF